MIILIRFKRYLLIAFYEPAWVELVISFLLVLYLRSMDGTGENCVVCSCGTPAILLTVKNPASNNLGKHRLCLEMPKPTSSSGRQFYKCSKREGCCDFFLWADSPTSGSGTNNATMSSSYHAGGSSQSYSRLAEHNCLCHVTSCDPQEYYDQSCIRTKLQMWIEGSKV